MNAVVLMIIQIYEKLCNFFTGRKRGSIILLINEPISQHLQDLCVVKTSSVINRYLIVWEKKRERWWTQFTLVRIKIMLTTLLIIKHFSHQALPLTCH